MTFDYQPTLTGKRLLLRPLRSTDYRSLFAVASDPLLWAQHPASDRYLEPVFRRFFDKALESNGALAVIDVRSAQIIGSSRFHGHDRSRGEVEIGWTFLARSYWGGEYNGELKDLMLRHAFQYVDNVVFLVGPENRRSQRAVEKIGGIRIGSRADDVGLVSFAYRIRVSDWRSPDRCSNRQSG